MQPLPWVIWFFSMEATIKCGVLATFLMAVFTLLSLLGTLFDLHGVSVLVWGWQLDHGNVVSGLSPFTMFYQGWKVSSFWIKTLWDNHGLVCPRRFVYERIHDFGFIQLLIVVKQGWHLCHYRIKIANHYQILSCCEIFRFVHFVTDVALLLGEAFCWTEIGHNMVHDQY